MTPGDSFQTCSNRDGQTAESIFIAAMFVLYGPEFVFICRLRGMEEEADEAEHLVEGMHRTVIEHGWDGQWFLRAYDDAGDKVGGNDCDEGRIFIEPQGFCVMAGIGVDSDHARLALDSVREHLETPHGIVLNSPCYSRYHVNLGEISSYPPGYKENAGIFCHNNPWIIIAETIIGRGDRAFDLYQRLAPAYIEELSDLHKTEPYVFSQMVAGIDAERHGEAKNSWLTGTAAWMYVATTQYVLGIRPDYEGLVVDPCVPAHWDGFRVTRRFRGAVYHIEVENPEHVCKGVASIRIDGHAVEGNMLPLLPAGTVASVHVTLG